MEIVNTRINELFLFKFLSEKQYMNNVKLSKRNYIDNKMNIDFKFD